jgi:MFS family permease
MIVLFAMSTFLCGFATNYASLFFWRALMGLGFGGQWASAAVLVGEAFGKADRGKAVGFMQSGWALGWGIAIFGMPPLAHYISQLTETPAWQILFWLGLSPVLLIPYVHVFVKESSLIADTRKSLEVPVWQILCWLSLSPALLIPYVRRVVNESPLVADIRKKLAPDENRADPLELFSPRMLSTTFWACVLSIGALCGYWAIILWLPVFLKKKGVDVHSDYYRALLIIGSGAGYLFSAWLSDVDRLGRRGNFMVCIIVLAGIFLLGLFPWLMELWRMDDNGTNGFTIFAILVAGLAFAAYLRSALIGEGDLFGRRRNFVLYAIFAIITVFACIYFAADKKIILMLAFPLGFFASGAFSGIGAFYTELFPTRMRGMGVGFAYNFGRGFAVLILWLIPVLAGSGLLLRSSPIPASDPLPTQLLGVSIGIFVLVAYGLMIIAALLLPEKEGRGLKDSDIEGAQETVPGARPQ